MKMRVQIIELENGVSTVFHTFTIDKFMTMERVIEICNARNRQFGHDNRIYGITEIAA